MRFSIPIKRKSRLSFNSLGLFAAERDMRSRGPISSMGWMSYQRDRTEPVHLILSDPKKRAMKFFYGRIFVRW